MTKQVLIGLLFFPSFLLVPRSASGEGPSFSREIRPILSEYCFRCHGPDENERKGGLRLDLEGPAKSALESGSRAIVPNDLEGSELWQRIHSDDPEEQMPPRTFGKSLSAEQKELLSAWIRSGGNWERHWSLTPPERAAAPSVKLQDWSLNPIDRFILAELEKRGMSPSPVADRVTLIRRVTLDLTGLPPKIEDVDRFLKDEALGAYERVVDRLLASPDYAERMAYPWLDASRYADTSGYQTDGEREMWRWRDWVIQALHRNQPFDEFTIEQLAGDLLPNPTLSQRIATGFNRNHRGNSEGGIVPEEFAVEYVVDRVDTTTTVWLGLTMGCARCHSHKYDPLSQKEYYGLFALFNQVPEKGRADKYGNSIPYIPAPTRQHQRELAEKKRRLIAEEQAWKDRQSEVDQELDRWAKSGDPNKIEDWNPDDQLLAWFPFNGTLEASASSETPPELTIQEGAPVFVHGVRGGGHAFDGRRFIECGQVGGFDFLDKFSISVWLKADPSGQGTICSKMTDVPEGDGYSVHLYQKKLRINFVKRWLDDALRLESAEEIPTDKWTHLTISYDGSRVAKGVKLFVDCQPVPLRTVLDELNQTFALPKVPFRIGAGNGPGERFRGYVDDLRLYSRVLGPEEIVVLATAAPLSTILKTPTEQLAPGERLKRKLAFLSLYANEDLRESAKRLRDLKRETERFEEKLPTVMVMQDLSERRKTFLLERGQYDRPKEEVGPGLPAALNETGFECRNRLDLARWLVDPKNPLTARVLVNRIWQTHFGQGFVKTVEDFGAQGEQPSHPELLDWLAVEFVDSGWNVKALHRLIVTSATYRQASVVRSTEDPTNRWLGRSPRLRFTAEMVRDQALAASGLLVSKRGGPSVKPYQPEGLWSELSASEYVQDHGEALYRRSLYTFWKRTIAPPTMMTFDAGGRETCVVRESRTNTPLQALTLLNETGFVEAARVLAQRAMTEAHEANRLEQIFRHVLSRKPNREELEILEKSFARHQARFKQNPAAAEKLIRIGESPVAAELDPVDLAAYTTMANMILNLDEAITRE